MATQVEIARHLDLSDRRVREVMKELGIDPGVDLDTIRVAYIRSLREKAAGRGGSHMEELTQVRVRESRANAVRVEMANLEKARLLVDISTVEPVLRDWAARSNTVIMAAGAKIVEAVESKHGVRLGDDVFEHLRTSLTALAGYPRELAVSLGEGGGGVFAEGTDIDG